MVLISPVMVEVTSQSWFCNSCHIMNSYYASWNRGPHKEVECVQCHIPPGATNFVSAKLNGLGQVVDDVLDRTNSKPSASVSDFACTRSSCHDLQVIRTRTKTKGHYKFDHGKHTDLEYAGVKVHCTTCHSHVRGDEHFQVDTNTCVTCHLAYPQPEAKRLPEVASAAPTASVLPVLMATSGPAGAGTDDTRPIHRVETAKVPTSDCQKCHDAPKHPIEYQGLRVVHEEYLAYGAACGSCHRGATAPTRKIKDEQCFTCHDFGMERMTSLEEMHKTHSAGKHKVQCFSCHGVTRHGPVAQSMRLDQIDCQACHRSQHLVQQQTYKSGMAAGSQPSSQPAHAVAGMGGGAPAVSPMFLAHVDCTGCHVQPRALHVKPLSGATVAAATAAACDACHKPGLGEKMIPMWQKNTRAAFDTISKRLPGDGKAVAGPAEAGRLVEDARRLLELVRVDGSWGVHSPKYTQKLLEDAQQKLNEADVLIKKAKEGAEKVGSADEKAGVKGGGA